MKVIWRKGIVSETVYGLDVYGFLRPDREDVVGVNWCYLDNESVVVRERSYWTVQFINETDI